MSWKLRGSSMVSSLLQINFHALFCADAAFYMLCPRTRMLVPESHFSSHILLLLNVLATITHGWLNSHQVLRGQHQHCSSSATRAQSWLAAPPLPSLHADCFVPESGQQPQNLLCPPATWILGTHSGEYTI